MMTIMLYVLDKLINHYCFDKLDSEHIYRKNI